MGAAIPTMFILLLLLVVPIAAGVALILTNRRRAAPFPKCGQCGYNLSASIGTTTRCPECGGEFGVVGITPTAARGRPFALWLGVAMVALPLMCVGTGIVYSLAARRAAEARAAQAAAARLQAVQAAQAAAAQPATVTMPASQPIEPLSAEEIAKMNEAELRGILQMRQHQRFGLDSNITADQRRDEFNLILQRLRELQQQQP